MTALVGGIYGVEAARVGRLYLFYMHARMGARGEKTVPDRGGPEECLIVF